jgi:hypothetical protein
MDTHMKRVIVALALLCCSPLSIADSGVLVERVPSAATTTVVMAVVRQALINHNWIVTSGENDAFITATLDQARTHTDMRVELVDGQLLYSGTTLNESSAPALQAVKTMRPIRIPSRWIRNIRHDVSMALATVKETSPR